MTKNIAKEHKSLPQKPRISISNTDMQQHLLQAKTKLKRIKEVDLKRTQEILNKDIHVKNIARNTQQQMDTLQKRKASITQSQHTEEALDIVYNNFDILSGSLDIVKIYVDDLFEKVETLNLTLNKVIDIQRIQLSESEGA
jgi:hypothetical protein